MPQGVAVYADNTLAALKGRAALKVEWDLSKAETRSSGAARQPSIAEKFARKGVEAANSGDVDKAFAADGRQTLEAESSSPTSRMRRWSRSTRCS